MLKNIKAIIFDADDTIINHRECEKSQRWRYCPYA